jgi:hypothetical protein
VHFLSINDAGGRTDSRRRERDAPPPACPCLDLRVRYASSIVI